MRASYSWGDQAFGGDTLGLGAMATDLNNIRLEFDPAVLDRTQRLMVSGVPRLQFFRNSATPSNLNVLGGLRVSLISTAFRRSCTDQPERR